MTKSRIFLFLLLAFLAGVGVRSLVAIPYTVVFGLFLGSGIVAALGALGNNKRLVIYACLLLACAGGIVRFDQVTERHPDLKMLYGRRVSLKGIVSEEPRLSEKSQQIKMRIASADGKSADFFLLITAGRAPRYALGDELLLDGAMDQPENFADDFDYVSYLARRDIYAVMLFPKIDKVGEGKGSRVGVLLAHIRHAFEGRLDAILPDPHDAFLKGLLLGDRASLPDELQNDFRITGTTHIVALSGYNITIVARFVIAVLLALTVPFQISFWIATAAITLFVLLTGASPSLVRAGIMGILVLLAQKEGRAYRVTNALVFAAAVMVFVNPRILRFDAAFQLSFLATAGLIYLSPHVARWVDSFFEKINPRRPPAHTAFSGKASGLKHTLVETISAQLMVLPLLISLFGKISLISPIINILVLAAVPYAMATGFAAGVAGFVWYPLSRVVGWAAWILLEYMIRVIEFSARIPFAYVSIGVWMIVPMLAFYGWCAWRLARRERSIERNRGAVVP